MLIATFGPESGWVGRAITYENGCFALEGHGLIRAGDVLTYDRQGHLLWAHVDLQEWVRQVAATGVDASQQAKWSTTPPTETDTVDSAAEERDVASLARALRVGEKASDRIAAAKALAKVGDPSAVEALGAALDDESMGVHQAAAVALAKIGGSAAVELLAAALRRERHPDPDIDADALRRIGGPGVFDLLVAALKEDYLWTRFGAAKALGKMGGPSVVEPLIAALNDEEQVVRRAAAAALGKIDDPRVLQPLAKARALDPYLD